METFLHYKSVVRAAFFFCFCVRERGGGGEEGIGLFFHSIPIESVLTVLTEGGWRMCTTSSR